MTAVARGKKHAAGLVALGDALAHLAAITERASESFTESLTELGAEVYRYPVPFRCSKACGEPIRFGELFVQTSKDWKPLERAHAACLAGRKGSDGVRAEAAA